MIKRRLGVLFTVAATVGAYVGMVPVTAASAHPLSAQPFSGYATGTQVSTDALTVGTTQVANVQEAFAGASVNSQGLASGIDNEMSQVVQPPLPGKNSYARGAGAEVGLVTNSGSPVDPNQLILSGLAEQSAPPNQPNPDVKTVGPVEAAPVLFASLLQGTAQAIYDPNFCPIGKPLNYGKGEAANVQVLPTAAGGPGGLVNTGIGSNTNTANTRSFQYFAPNGDGTFGLISETRQHLVPIGVGTPVAGISPLTVQVDGDFIMRVRATGKPGLPAFKFIGDPLVPGPASIEFSDPLVTITGPLGVPVPPTPLKLSALLNIAPISIPGIATITVDGLPRAIGGLPGTAAAISPDGTSVAAGYDLLRIALLPVLGVLNLRVGHMEGTATVPPGGVKCDIPLIKTGTPDPAQAGQDVTITITIPDPVKFPELFACDLINISATDTHRVLEGNPRFQITGASNGGIIEGDSVRWPNLGNYTRGSPPIQLTVTVHVIGGTGVLEDTVDVSATLGNCTGGIAGQDITGSGLLDGGAVLGNVTFGGPRIGGGKLAATGENGKYLLLGGAMLFGAVAVMGVRRRLRAQSSSAEPS